MKKAIIGKKIGMTQIFDENGKVIPVTVVQAGPCGACSDPSRVFKGKKMSGHLGAERVTVQNLAVVKVDVENNLIAIKGAVPGPKGGIVFIRNSVKA